MLRKSRIKFGLICILVAVDILLATLLFTGKSPSVIPEKAEPSLRQGSDLAVKHQQLTEALTQRQILLKELQNKITAKRPFPKGSIWGMALRMGDLYSAPEKSEIALDYFKGQVRIQYATLFSRLHLSAKIQQDLSTMLARDAAQRAAKRSMAERQKIPEDLQSLDDQLHAGLQQLVGTEKTSMIEKVHQNPFIGNQIQQFDYATRDTNNPLTDNQYSALLEIRSSTLNTIPMPAKPEDVENAVLESKLQHEEILRKAKDSLNPEQLNILKRQLVDEEAWLRGFLYASVGSAPR